MCRYATLEGWGFATSSISTVSDPPVDRPESPEAAQPWEPGTPQAVATNWVDAVMDRSDLVAAWPITDPVLRLVFAQDWVWTYRHHAMIGHQQDWTRSLGAWPPARRAITCGTSSPRR